MRDLLSRINIEEATPKVSPAEESKGRTAELRKKFAHLLNANVGSHFRPPLDEAARKRFVEQISPCKLQALHVDLLEYSNGESGTGLFLPELHFLGTEEILTERMATDYAIDCGLLPKFIACLLPFFRDLVGNQFLVFSEEYREVVEGGGAVYLLDSQESVLCKVSRGIGEFIHRLVLANELNVRSGREECRGDFFNLSESEIDISRVVDGDFYPYEKYGCRFALNRPRNIPSDWSRLVRQIPKNRGVD